VRNRQSAAPFFALGFAFIAIGASRQRAFAVIGIAFLAIAIVRLRASRK
jgi:mannose/fructose/N-acetylgalactosamine-specific phosphotransferase system component IIC